MANVLTGMRILCGLLILYFPAFSRLIAVIALIKIGCHFAGFIKYHQFKTVHSALNKVCGGITFIVPLFIGRKYAWQVKSVAVITICIITSIAGIVEGITILENRGTN